MFIPMDEKIEELRKNLYDVTSKERNNHKKVYEIIETYAKNNDVFISNQYQVSGLDHHIGSLSDFHYAIYCSRPLEHANRLINLIYTELDNDPMIGLLNMTTAIKNEEFAIIHDTRFIVRIYAVQRNRPKGKSIDISKLIKPKIIKGIKYLPPEIELIEVYNALSSGCDFGVRNVDILLEFEKRMSEEVLKTIGGDIKLLSKKIKGGGDDSDSNDSNDNENDNEDDSNDSDSNDNKNTNDKSNKSPSCYERKKDEIEILKLLIIKDFLANRKDMMFLGPMAVEWVEKGIEFCPKNERIQLISTLTPEQIKSELEDYLKSVGKSGQLSMSEPLDLLIPKDFRTRRTVFSMSIRTDFGIKEKPFLEYFNTAMFDPVSAFLKDQIWVANKFAMLRFLFVDAWVAKFIHSLGKIDDRTYVNKQKRTMDLIKRCNNWDFLVEGIMGTYYEYTISKKEQRIGQEKFYLPYYPAEYFRQNNKLREV